MDFDGIGAQKDIFLRIGSNCAHFRLPRGAKWSRYVLAGARDTQRFIFYVVERAVVALCPSRCCCLAHFSQVPYNTTRTMKLSIAILSLAATASAFTPSAPARSVARVGGSSVLAPVPVRAAGT